MVPLFFLTACCVLSQQSSSNTAARNMGTIIRPRSSLLQPQSTRTVFSDGLLRCKRTREHISSEYLIYRRSIESNDKYGEKRSEYQSVESFSLSTQALQIVYVDEMVENPDSDGAAVSGPLWIQYEDCWNCGIISFRRWWADIWVPTQHTECSNTALPLQIYLLFIILPVQYCRGRWGMNAQQTKNTLKMN